MAEKTTNTGISTIKFMATILEKQNKSLVVGEISIYLPGLGVGQVLVKVHCASICGAQIGEISGAAGPDKYLPHLLGHEGAGVVEEIGAGVTHVEKGDHVVMHWRKGNGIEAKPPKYKWRNGEVGAGPIATFAEYAIVSENRLTRIDEDIPFQIAALMGCAVTTGLGIINNEAKLKIGQSIAVIGCGGVGLNVVQGAKIVSANPIIAIDIHDEKLDMARHFGATHTINGRDFLYSPKAKTLEDVLSSLAEQINKIAILDVAIECTGKSGLMELGYKIIGAGGRLILVGQPRYDEAFTIHSMRQHYCGKTVLDSQGGQTNPSRDIPRYLNLFKLGKLDLAPLITHRYPLTQINKAVETVKSGMCGKVILEMK